MTSRITIRGLSEWLHESLPEFFLIFSNFSTFSFQKSNVCLKLLSLSPHIYAICQYCQPTHQNWLIWPHIRICFKKSKTLFFKSVNYRISNFQMTCPHLRQMCQFSGNWMDWDQDWCKCFGSASWWPRSIGKICRGLKKLFNIICSFFGFALTVCFFLYFPKS